MTAPTPEQMRELADAAANLTVDNDWDATVIADVMTTLRAAADQLEEDQRVIEGIRACWKVDMLALEAMREAD